MRGPTEAEEDPSVVRVYTDGSFADGFAGWGWVAVRGESVVAHRFGPVVPSSSDDEWCGARFHSNNAGEISVVCDALRWVEQERALERESVGGAVVLIPDSWWAIRAAKGA